MPHTRTAVTSRGLSQEHLLYALTLHRPWAAAILYDTKRTENRTWAPKNLPGRIGLHAGRTIDRAGVQRLSIHLGRIDLPDSAFYEGLVGTAHLTATHTAASCPGEDSCRVWGASTGHHWLLTDVRALQAPIPARGHQRLWRLTREQQSALAQAEPVPDITQRLAVDAASHDLAALLRARTGVTS